MEIKARSIAEAWLKGSEYVLKTTTWEENTLVLRVASPVRVRRSDDVVARMLEAFLVSHGGLTNHTVAETIFPGYEYKRRGVDGVFVAYPKHLYPALRAHPRRSWGRYAQRLVERKKVGGGTWNPLAKTIDKLKNRRGLRGSFELGGCDEDHDDGSDIPLYDDEKDGKTFRSLPCLSHLSFHVFDGDKLHLTGLYRSHYYVQRLYGNLLGLARLQDFVAAQTGLRVGELVCHSMFARLEYGNPKEGCDWKKDDVKQLLRNARAAFDAARAK